MEQEHRHLFIVEIVFLDIVMFLWLKTKAMQFILFVEKM